MLLFTFIGINYRTIIKPKSSKTADMKVNLPLTDIGMGNYWSQSLVWEITAYRYWYGKFLLIDIGMGITAYRHWYGKFLLTDIGMGNYCLQILVWEISAYRYWYGKFLLTDIGMGNFCSQVLVCKITGHRHWYGKFIAVYRYWSDM